MPAAKKIQMTERLPEAKSDAKPTGLHHDEVPKALPVSIPYGRMLCLRIAMSLLAVETEEMAKVLGVSRQHLEKCVNGQRAISDDLLEKILSALPPATKKGQCNDTC